MPTNRSPRRVVRAIAFLILLVALTTTATLAAQAVPAENENHTPIEQGAELTPAGECNVPLYGTFGQDMEVMTAPWGVGDAFLHNLSTMTNVPPVVAGLNAHSRVDAVAYDLDRVVAVFRRDAELFYTEWMRLDNTWQRPEPLSSASDFEVVGNPSVVSKAPGQWAVFVRTGDGMIKMRQFDQDNFGEWTNTWEPGHAWAASDPAPVSKDAGHMAVFFVDTDDKVRGSDFIAGKWRNIPYTLGDRAFKSTLAIVSPNPNRIAIFGIDQAGALYVRQWADLHQPDWSDTDDWRKLMDQVRDERPAVVTRHTNHMAVAVMDSGTAVTLFEWSHSRAGDENPENDWQSTSLGGYNNTSLFAYATDTDTMAVGVTNTGNQLYQRVWNEDGGWGNWSHIGDAAPGLSNLAVAIPTPDEDLMLSNNGFSLHHTFSGLSTTNTYRAQARPGANVLARAEGNVYWITAPYTSGERWRLESRGTTETAFRHGTWLDHWGPDHIGQISMAAGDLTHDGNDEVIVSSSNGGWLDLSVVEVASDGRLTIKNKYTKRWSHFNQDVNVAVGDLDGDGKRNEIVIATQRFSYTPDIYLFVYRYENGTITPILEDHNVKPSLDDQPFVTDIAMTVAADSTQGGDQIFLLDQVMLNGIHPLTHVRRLSLHRDVQARKWNVSESAAAPAFGDTTASGERTTALTAGDIDMDGQNELVAIASGRLSLFELQTDGTILPLPSPAIAADRNVSLAVGDLNRDGRDEVVAGMTGTTQVFYYSGSKQDWDLLGQDNQWGDVLIGDLDGDSDVSMLYGCEKRRDVHVVAVVNAAPRYYENGTPLHDSAGEYGRSKSTSESSSSLARGIYGTSFTVGFEVEQDVPLVGFKVASFRADATVEFVGSNFTQNENSKSIAESTGFTFTEDASSDSGSAVIYREVAYDCYYYWLYKPTNPDRKHEMRACTVASEPDEVAATIEDWNSKIKNEAGDSWARVEGRLNNDIETQDYSRTTFETLDRSQLLWEMAGDIDIQSGIFPRSWSMESSEGNVTTSGGSFEGTLTVNMEAVTGPLVSGRAFTVGGGGEWSHSTEWTSGLSFGGSVDYYPACIGCGDYSIVPYVYWATARRDDGQTYQYLVQDYYVSEREAGGPAAATSATASVTAGPVPQAPIVNSATHPDPAEWYTADDLTLTWQQPAGDAATIAGYSWQLSKEANLDHTSLATEQTNSATYEDVEDGLYYFHIQAVNEEGERSPMTTRAVRIDATSPRPQFVLDPAVPDGFNGWYTGEVTVEVEAGDNHEVDGAMVGGSGVETIEISSDGLNWQPYTVQHFVTNTITTTLWARATDAVGNISDPISTTIKIDLNAPSSIDPDGAGLSYVAIAEDDDRGNAQLVLGGIIDDDFSGRDSFEIRPGSYATWRMADRIGEFPMPDDNIFTSTVTTLNWIYTPTFKLRGDYPLYGRAIDAAGNVENEYELGSFTWFPEADPELIESQVTIYPTRAAIGDEVEVTIGVRNTGYQESKVIVTNTLPAELSIVAGTVTDSGAVDDNQITWMLHDGVWPGQTQYLTFRATVESGSGPVHNTVTLQPYWEGLDADWIIDEYGDQFVLPRVTDSATLTIGGANVTASVDETAQLLSAWVQEGQITTSRDVTISLDATLAAKYLRVVEWKWDNATGMWVEAQDRGLLSLDNDTPDLTVIQGEVHLNAALNWQLSAGDGAKYLGVFVGDAEQHMTPLNKDNLIWVNLMDANGQTVEAGERIQYRLKLNRHELNSFNMFVQSGAAKLSVWEPRNGFYPDYVATGTTGPVSLTFQATESGLYLLEVEGLSDGTAYTLQQSPTAEQVTLARAHGEEGVVPNEHPLTLSTPFGLNPAEVVGRENEVHLPVFWR